MPALQLDKLDKSTWQTFRFEQIARSISERVEPSQTDLETYVGLEHIDPDSIHIKRFGSKDDVSGTKLRCYPGDVIFGRRRAYQRKAAICEFDGFCSAHSLVLRANPKVIDPKLFPFFLHSDTFMHRAVDISVGSLSPTINWTTLKTQEFLLPPKDQQAKLAELLWAADAAVRASQKACSKAERARKSYLRHSFANHHEDKTQRVANAGEVKMGRQRAPKYQTGKHTKPYLRVANVFDCFFDYSDVLTMDFDKRDFDTFRLRKGDILLNEGQSRELVGRCAIYDGAIEDCCFQNTLIRYRAGDSILSEYAFAYFQFCYHFGRFAAISSQTTSVAHLGADRFGSLRMPIPSKDIQRKIATRDEQLRNVAAEQRAHRDRCQRLLKSLINQVF